MPPGSDSEAALLPGPRTRDTEGEECPQNLEKYSEQEVKLRDIPAPEVWRAWLPWASNGCEHGLKCHKIAKNGYVYESEDVPTEPKRKPKAVSSRQWTQGGRC